jgi:hypothetical protein
MFQAHFAKTFGTACSSVPQAIHQLLLQAYNITLAMTRAKSAHAPQLLGIANPACFVFDVSAGQESS